MKIPSIYILHDILFDEGACLNYLLNRGVFYESILCDKCGSEMNRNVIRWTFRCGKKNCRREISIRKYTFFFESQLKCHQIMQIGLFWINKLAVLSTISLTGHSSKTITDFYSHFRKLVSATLEKEDTMIGGEGITVQLDESKFGKRKNHRGHNVDGVWIFGGVEDTEEKKVFLCQVNDRSHETLIPLIKKFVLPGSTIITDMWGGYFGLEDEEGYDKHLLVNHSKTFKDPDTTAHTNNIEGTWNGIKINLKSRNRTKHKIEEHLFEYIWRRKNKNNLWDSLINAIQITDYNI